MDYGRAACACRKHHRSARSILHVNFLAPAGGAVLNGKASRAGRLDRRLAQVDLTTNEDGGERSRAVALAALRVVDIKSEVKSV